MIEAVLVAYSACIVRSEKENHMNIFSGVHHIGYMIILHDNIPHKQIRKQRTRIHGEPNNNIWYQELVI